MDGSGLVGLGLLGGLMDGVCGELWFGVDGQEGGFESSFR